MIQSLLNTLLNEQKIPELIPSLETSFLIISSGNYRSNETSRLVILVFQNTKLSLIIKLYKSNNSKIYNEYEQQKSFYDIFPNLIAKPLLCEEINGFNILIEKPIEGKNFNRYLYDNLSKNSINHSLKLVLNFHKKLNSNLELSNSKYLIDEVSRILETFSENFSLSSFDIKFIQQCKSIFLKNFKEKTIFQRYSNHDFISRNFIIKDQQIILVDFEFTKKTSLYFFEWFQFFKYNWPFLNDYMHDIFISKIQDPFFCLALQEFSKYRKNNKFIISCRLIFEIQEFVKQFTVFSIGSKQILKKDMRFLLNDLQLRFKNQNESNIISDISNTEAKLFNQKFDKLTAYKKTYERNFLKNSLKDKDKVILGLENSLKETKSYLENSLKDKDKVILGLENSLKETKSYLENSVKDYQYQIEQINHTKIMRLLRIIDKIQGKTSN